MRTFPLKVHYKAIKILAVRWVGTRLLMLTETTTRDKSWAVSWERRQSQCVQFSLWNTVKYHAVAKRRCTTTFQRVITCTICVLLIRLLLGIRPDHCRIAADFHGESCTEKYPFNHRWRFLASSDFGRMLLVGAIRPFCDWTKCQYDIGGIDTMHISHTMKSKKKHGNSNLMGI